MKIEHIVSTMNRDEFSFLSELKMQAPCLVVNQNKPEKEFAYSLEKVEARIICTPEKGLSRSRNKLIENAVGDVLIIGDDDVEYKPDYLDYIKKAYEKLPNADIIVFRFTNDKEKETRARYSKIKRLKLFNISKCASVEITFRRESIIKSGVRFNNEIGLGTRLATGEENAFLADALRAGLKIYHYPKTICYAEEAHTLGDIKNVEEYLTSKGGAYHCIYKKWFFFFALAFILIKKRSLFRGISVKKAYKWMKQGKKQYKLLEKK